MTMKPQRWNFANDNDPEVRPRWTVKTYAWLAFDITLISTAMYLGWVSG